MTDPAPPFLRVAIACGGTGGHFFPGLAVAEQLRRCGAAVTLLISPKEVDQQALESASGLQTVTLPAVGLARGGEMAFIRGFARSYRAAKAAFSPCPPRAALAMGGFTSAPPLLAARRLGAWVFLHESNSIPGRANRWLSWFVHRAFVGFATAGPRLHTSKVIVTGTPVRSQFQPREAAGCRAALGLHPAGPVLLVMGGSQGASAINSLVGNTLPLLAGRFPHWQWLHLAGSAEVEAVKRAYATAGLPAQVHPFFTSMELALGAATAAISRAGASSLAELAAMRLPSVLIPYPFATDDHQLHNARALEATGAARLLEQKAATPQSLAALLADLVENPAARLPMQDALARWHCPQAASHIAQSILEAIAASSLAPRPQPNCPVSAVSVAAASSIFSLLLS
jgi:UDP-N-acetylglucosamine--N-acetylmuramyl-(pentapeptide) pyrophosphoryl-undecaprenol N-acetylglucosamine transferase